MRGRESIVARAENAVKRETEAAQKQQRRQIARHEMADHNGNVHRAVAARKILNDGRQQHIQQAAPHQAALRRLGRAGRGVLPAAFRVGQRLAA